MPPRRKRRPAAGERTPEVVLDFEYSGGLLYISIENVGTSAAHGVSVKFDKEIAGVEGAKKISSLNMFRNLEFLPPGKKIRAFVDNLQSYLARKQPMVIRASVTYRGKDGSEFVDKMTHDLSIYRDLPEAV